MKISKAAAVVEAKVLQSINELYKLLYKMDNMEQEIILYLFWHREKEYEKSLRIQSNYIYSYYVSWKSI